MLVLPKQKYSYFCFLFLKWTLENNLYNGSQLTITQIYMAKSFGFEVKICKQTADWTSFTCFNSEDLVVKRGKHRAWLIIDLSTYTNEWQMAQHSSENVIFRTRKFVQVTFKKTWLHPATNFSKYNWLTSTCLA